MDSLSEDGADVAVVAAVASEIVALVDSEQDGEPADFAADMHVVLQQFDCPSVVASSASASVLEIADIGVVAAVVAAAFESLLVHSLRPLDLSVPAHYSAVTMHAIEIEGRMQLDFVVVGNE